MNACLFDGTDGIRGNARVRDKWIISCALSTFYSSREKYEGGGKGKASKHTDALRKEREDDVRPSIAVE